MDKLKQKLLDLGVKNLILRENGEVSWQFLTKEHELFNQYSITKSFTALACLLVCQSGITSLNSSVADLVKQVQAIPDKTVIHYNAEANLAKTPASTSYEVGMQASLSQNLRKLDLQPLVCTLPKRARLEQLTLANLLNMTTGHGQAHMFVAERSQFAVNFNAFDYCLNLSFARRPGSHFLYTNAGPYMAGVLVQALCKKRLSDILVKLFKNGLNMEDIVWKQDALAYEFGASELFLTTQQLSKFAEILRLGGLGYIDEAVIKQATSLSYVNADKGIYYGYGFWLYPDGAYRADGSHGQYVFVDAKRQRSLAVNSLASDERSLKELLYREFIAN